MYFKNDIGYVKLEGHYVRSVVYGTCEQIVKICHDQPTEEVKRLAQDYYFHFVNELNVLEMIYEMQ